MGLNLSFGSRSNDLVNSRLERNGHVVRLASYAPLLPRQNHTQWRPDMIYFDHTNLLLTPILPGLTPGR